MSEPSPAVKGRLVRLATNLHGKVFVPTHQVAQCDGLFGEADQERPQDIHFLADLPENVFRFSDRHSSLFPTGNHPAGSDDPEIGFFVGHADTFAAVISAVNSDRRTSRHAFPGD
jgi:hypothetical protein